MLGRQFWKYSLQTSETLKNEVHLWFKYAFLIVQLREFKKSTRNSLLKSFSFDANKLGWRNLSSAQPQVFQKLYWILERRRTKYNTLCNIIQWRVALSLEGENFTKNLTKLILDEIISIEIYNSLDSRTILGTTVVTHVEIQFFKLRQRIYCIQNFIQSPGNIFQPLFDC